MAIKDRDGKVYKLRGPNPLLKTQQEWDRSRIQLHNMGHWTSEVVTDERNPVEEMNANIINIGEELKLTPNPDRTKTIDPRSFIEQIQQAEPKPVPQAKEKPVPVLNVDNKTARLLKERGVTYFCAPAVGKRTHTDDLYGTSYDVIEYGPKFLFDAIIIDQSDLELQFWCVKSITSGSVIYKKDQQGGERWWRVRDVEAKTGGWLALALTSDSNPDFS